MFNAAGISHTTHRAPRHDALTPPPDMDRLREEIVTACNSVETLQDQLKQAREHAYAPTAGEWLRTLLLWGSGHHPNPQAQALHARLEACEAVRERLFERYYPLAMAESLKDVDERIVQAQGLGKPTAELLAQEEALKLGIALQAMQRQTDATLPITRLLVPETWMGVIGTCHALTTGIGRVMHGTPTEEPSTCASAGLAEALNGSLASGDPGACLQSSASDALAANRTRTDVSVDALAGRLPDPAFVPSPDQQGAIFSLLTQLQAFPANTTVELHDAQGHLQASYGDHAPGMPGTMAIKLQLDAEGGYRYLGNATEDAPAVVQPLELVIKALPAGCELGKGGNFPGAESLAGRIVTVREQMAALARQQRVQLFSDLLDADHACRSGMDEASAATRRFLPQWTPNCGQHATPLIEALTRRYPALSRARLDEVLAAHPLSLQQQDDCVKLRRLPAAFSREIERALRHERTTAALDAVEHLRAFDPQADRLNRLIASSELAAMGRTLYIHEAGAPPYVSRGENDTAVVLHHFGNGRYQVLDLRNGGLVASTTDADSFHLSLAMLLQPHERCQLGMAWDTDIRGIRQAFSAQARNLVGCAEDGLPREMPSSAEHTQATTSPRDLGDGLANFEPSRLLTNAHGENATFNGIGRLERAACSAFLLDMDAGQAPETGSAYAMTAAHCVNDANGRIWTHIDLRDIRVRFNLFQDTTPVPLAVRSVEWSSLNGVDLAVLKLNATLGQVRGMGLNGWRLASHLPADGDDILALSAPTMPGQTGTLRMAACTHWASGETGSSSGHWVWRRTAYNECRDIAGGSSGGPLIDRQSGQVFAVLNTASTTAPLSYGTQATHLSQCFVDGELVEDPNVCPLYPAYNFEVSDTLPRFAKIATNSHGEQQVPAWNFDVYSDMPWFRYKTTTNPIECEIEAGYGTTFPSNHTHVDARLNPAPGRQMLCLIGIQDPASSVAKGTLLNALTLKRTLLPAGPAKTPQVSVNYDVSPSGQRGFRVRWPIEPLEHKAIRIKSGSLDVIDCDDPSGYADIFQPGYFVPLDQAPYQLCLKGLDHADQESAPAVVELTSAQQTTEDDFLEFDYR